MARTPKRRFQFSLRTLFLAMTVVVVVIVAWPLTPAERQRAMVQSVRELGGNVAYRDAPVPKSLASHIAFQGRAWLPRDYFDDVFNVQFAKSKATDEDLSKLVTRHRSEFGQLESIFFISTPLTDDGLRHLDEFKQLKLIALIDTKVTDAGEAEFRKGLPDCEIRRRQNP